MAQVKVLKCDHCKSVVFAVGTLSLHNGREKNAVASLDLCEKHAEVVKQIFKAVPSPGSKRPRSGVTFEGLVKQLTAWVAKQSKPFGLKAAQQALGVPDQSYTTFARAAVALRQKGLMKKQGNGRRTLYVPKRRRISNRSKAE